MSGSVTIQEMEAAARVCAADEKDIEMTNKVQKIDSKEIAEQQDQSASVLQIIQHAATNPNVDIDKMERLLQMQERILEREAKASYSAAFAQMQTDIESVEKKGKGHGTTYAKWEHINEMLKPVLTSHGFGLSFRTARSDKEITITAVLSHRDGHSEQTEQSFPLDTSGSKNGIQAVGSSMSYGKRYTASALLNITSHDTPDDDGAAAGGDEPITEGQCADLLKLIEETETDVSKFCKFLKINSVAEMPMSKLGKAEAMLNAKKAKEVQS